MNTSERTTRAVPIHDVIHWAIITLFTLEPITIIISTMYISEGRPISISTIRIIIISTRPPAKPAIPPYKTPMHRLIIAATTPTVSDMRAPYSTRTSMSRPNLSVPKGCAQLGPILPFSISCAS